MCTCRAYKLGKKRWSYNQCALTVKEDGGGQSMDVVDCMQYGQPTLSNLELVRTSLACLNCWETLQACCSSMPVCLMI